MPARRCPSEGKKAGNGTKLFPQQLGIAAERLSLLHTTGVGGEVAGHFDWGILRVQGSGGRTLRPTHSPRLLLLLPSPLCHGPVKFRREMGSGTLGPGEGHRVCWHQGKFQGNSGCAPAPPILFSLVPIIVLPPRVPKAQSELHRLGTERRQTAEMGKS